MIKWGIGPVARLVGAACAVSVLAACSGGGTAEQRAPSEVKVGLLAPLTGPHAADGRAELQGAQLAVEVVNGSYPEVPLSLAPGTGLPALGNARLRVLASDSHSSPDQGGERAVGLANNGVAGIVGAYDTDVTQAASQRTERSGVPWLNGDSAARYLTELGMDWFFRVGPNDRMVGQVFFTMMRQQPAGAPALRRIAVVHMRDDPTVSDVLGSVEQLTDDGGFEIADVVAVGRGDQALREGVDEVRADDVDGVFLVASATADAVRLAKAFREPRYSPPGVVIGGGFASPDFDKGAGRAGDGWLQSRLWSPELAQRNPAAKAVADLYRQRFKTPMTETAAVSFTAMYTLAQAIQNAGSVERAQVRSALLALNVPGSQLIVPWHGIRFDENRQNVGASGVVEQRIGGQERLVFPRELARTPATWSAAEAPQGAVKGRSAEAARGGAKGGTKDTATEGPRSGQPTQPAKP